MHVQVLYFVENNQISKFHGNIAIRALLEEFTSLELDVRVLLAMANMAVSELAIPMPEAGGALHETVSRQHDAAYAALATLGRMRPLQV